MDVIFNLHQFDFVFHLAAEYGRWNGDDHYENLWRTNVIGTKNMLRLQEIHRFQMIFFSSAEVYGDYGQLMSEEIMEQVPIQQMNDYAISKWAGELQCINNALMHGTKTVRLRLVGCYGPHEFYSPYRGVIPIFVYKALAGSTLTVHRGHIRIFDYVDDTCRTISNIVDNFIPGEVYNIGSKEDWSISIEELAEIIIEATSATSNQVQLKESEDFTTKIKLVDFSKSRRDLSHSPSIGIHEGINRYVLWMRKTYDFSNQKI